MNSKANIWETAKINWRSTIIVSCMILKRKKIQ